VTIGAWAVGDAELESGEGDSEEEEEEEEEEAREGGESTRALATSLAALRRTETKRVDPMASLVESLRESRFYEAARG
jgi:TATA-binding protein-associated factor Taf7